jgi:hypothetical protein
MRGLRRERPSGTSNEIKGPRYSLYRNIDNMDESAERAETLRNAARKGALRLAFICLMVILEAILLYRYGAGGVIIAVGGAAVVAVILNKTIGF